MIGFNPGNGTGVLSNPLTNTNFDYRAEQAKLKATLAADKKITTAADAAQTPNSTVKTLKKETAEFLDSYINNNEAMKKTAEALSGNNIDKLLAGKDGSTPEENIKAVVDAAQKMVDSYNKNLANLQKNADRGSAVPRQINRMTQNPSSTAGMKMIGMSQNKDGTLSLDQGKLTEALSGSETGADFAKDLLKDVAQGVKRDASAGLNESATSVVNNDIAKIKEAQTQPPASNTVTRPSQKDENPFALMGMYARSGAYNMMNMGTIGLLMNTFA